MVDGAFRGGLQVDDILYGAWEGEVYRTNVSGERELVGSLSGKGRVFFARNNAATPNVVAVSTGTVVTVVSTAVAAYPDADVTATRIPTCVCGHMGYFMWGYDNGDILSSDLNSTNVNTLNSARTESNPDGVLNMLSQSGQLYVFGSKTIEVWGDPVNATGFPLSRIGYNILPGLLAPHAVAGSEPEFGYPFIWVGSDATVRQLNGYEAVKISTSDLERLIADVKFPATQLDALCYVLGGSAFWQLNGPNWSWVYHIGEGTWHERQSEGSTRSNLTCSVPAFDEWLVGSIASSDLFAMDFRQQREGSEQIVSVVESGPAKDFPNRQRIPRIDFDFTPGVGEAQGIDPIQTDPSVLIEISRDGGVTWPLSYVRKLGKQAKYLQRVFVLNAGLSGDEGVRVRWTISDPVHVGFTGADMKTEIRDG